MHRKDRDGFLRRILEAFFRLVYGEAGDLVDVDNTIIEKAPKFGQDLQSEVEAWEQYYAKVRRGLIRELHAARRDGDIPDHWVMSALWWRDCINLTDPDGRRAYEFGNKRRDDRLFGLPVYVVKHDQKPTLLSRPRYPNGDPRCSA